MPDKYERREQRAQDRRARGVCIVCGLLPPKELCSTCASCLERNHQARTALKAWRRQQRAQEQR
jgi:hypothetical protein